MLPRPKVNVLRSMIGMLAGPRRYYRSPRGYSLPRPRGRSKALDLLPSTYCVAPSHGPNGGVADSLDEAKAAFRRRGSVRFLSAAITPP